MSNAFDKVRKPVAPPKKVHAAKSDYKRNPKHKGKGYEE
jgi:hypothetical protein